MDRVWIVRVLSGPPTPPTLSELYVVVAPDGSTAMRRAERFVTDCWPNRTRVTAKFADRAVTFDQYTEGPVLGRLAPF